MLGTIVPGVAIVPAMLAGDASIKRLDLDGFRSIIQLLEEEVHLGSQHI